MFELIPFATRKNVFNPFRDFDDLEREFFSHPSFAPVDFKTDVKDMGNAFELSAELPGLNKEDIKLDLEDQTLTISAERKAESEENENGYIHRERSYGSVSRSFNLDGIKADEIKAKYENGILTIILPKEEQKVTGAKRLEIE